MLDAVTHPGARRAVLGDVDEVVSRAEDRYISQVRSRRVADHVRTAQSSMRRTQLEEGTPPTLVERAPVIGRGVPPAADRHPDPTAYEMSDVVTAQPFGPCLPPRDQPIGTRTQACEGCPTLELLHPTTVGARRRPHPMARRCLWRTAPGTPLLGGMRLLSLCNRRVTADTPS